MIEHEWVILTEVALGDTMRDALASTRMRDGCFQPAARFERGVNRSGRDIKVTHADDEMYEHIREFERDSFGSNAEQVAAVQVTQGTVEMPPTQSDDRVADVLVVPRDFKTSVKGESTNKHDCIPMTDSDFHVNLGVSDHDRRDMTSMTDCDPQGVTAAATASTSKQCTVDDFVMKGQQIKVESVEGDGDAKTGSSSGAQKYPTRSLKSEDECCYRELTTEEIEWWT